MGGGRRTQTHTLDVKAEGNFNFQKNQRNLTEEEFGGCIFGCTDDTYEECVKGLIFGLPPLHWLYVQYVKKGMPIFLWSFTSKMLFGIWEADTDGTWKLNPTGWNQGIGSQTRFPAQVRVKEYNMCKPIHERELRDILKDSWRWDGIRYVLLFELKKSECSALSRKFAENSGKPTRRITPSGTSAIDSEGFTHVRGGKFQAAPVPTTNPWGPTGSKAQAVPVQTTGPTLDPGPFGGVDCAPSPPAKQPYKAPEPPQPPLSKECEKLGLDELHEATWLVDPDMAERWWRFGTVIARSFDVAASERNYLFEFQRALQEKVEILVSEVQTLRRDLVAVGRAGSARMAVSPTTPNLLHMQLSTRKALYMFGGQFSYDKSTLGVEQSVAFCPSIPSMIDLPLSSGPARSTAAAAALKRSIYILGGAVDTEWVRTVIRLDLDTLEWHDVAPMQAPHGGGGATALGDRIYAVGGLANGAASTLCDVLEPERDHWTPLPMLNRTRYNCAVTALGGSLYCAGGYDNQVYLSTMERLDPREGKRWTEVDSMQAKRGALTLEVTDDNHLMAIAGWGNDDRSGTATGSLHTTEIYDVRVNAWQSGPSLKAPRAFAASGVIDGRVYVLGGVGVTEESNTIVEVWEPGASEWSIFPAPFTPHGRSRSFTAHVVA